MAFSVKSAKFTLSEVKLGVIPVSHSGEQPIIYFNIHFYSFILHHSLHLAFVLKEASQQSSAKGCTLYMLTGSTSHFLA